MDAPTPIDLATWPRREHFAHYLSVVPCTYSMTVQLDVTNFVPAVRASKRRTYIAQIWAIANVVNRHEAFKMILGDSGEPAVWNAVHPSFTIFNAARETFSSVWVPFNTCFDSFHGNAARVIDAHAESTELFPQGPRPRNAFDVSSLPWASFTGFTLNVAASNHLAPIFTLGRYIEDRGRTLLPMAVQIHHAAADGFHTTRVIAELNELLGTPTWLTE